MKRGMISETIIIKLREAGTNGISIEDLAIAVYKRNNRKTQLRIIKNVARLRIKKGLDIR